jgi:hypothetical protein
VQPQRAPARGHSAEGRALACRRARGIPPTKRRAWAHAGRWKRTQAFTSWRQTSCPSSAPPPPPSWPSSPLRGLGATVAVGVAAVARGVAAPRHDACASAHSRPGHTRRGGRGRAGAHADGCVAGDVAKQTARSLLCGRLLLALLGRLLLGRLLGLLRHCAGWERRGLLGKLRWRAAWQRLVRSVGKSLSPDISSRFGKPKSGPNPSKHREFEWVARARSWIGLALGVISGDPGGILWVPAGRVQKLFHSLIL